MTEFTEHTEQVTPQETPLFVATCVYTKAVWRAIYQIQLLPVMRLLIGLVLLQLILVLISVAGGGYIVTDAVALSFLLQGVLLLLAVWRPYRYAARQCAVAQTLFGRERTARVWFYADRLLQVEYPTGGQVTISYTLIRRVVLTPALVILQLPNGIYLPVERSQFEYGDGRQLAPFLKQQNPRLVVRGKY